MTVYPFSNPAKPLAIIAMEAGFNTIPNLEAFFKAIFTGETPSASSDSINLEAMIEKVIAQASLDKNQRERLKVISTRWDNLADLLSEASRWMATGEIDAVVLAASDPPAPLTPTASQAAAAIILKPLDLARKDGNPVLAVIRSGGKGQVSASPIEEALRLAGVSAQAIGYLEAPSCGDNRVDRQQFTSLCQAYHGPGYSCGLGITPLYHPITTVTGHLLTLIKATLSLHHRLIPANPGWISPPWPEIWDGSSFYIPVESRTWFHPDNGTSRYAAVHLVNADGSYLHLVLSGEHSGNQPATPVLHQANYYLFPVTASTPDQLIDMLASLKETAGNTSSLYLLAQERMGAFKRQPAHPFTASLVAHQPAELVREIDLAVKGIPSAMARHSEWQTPSGSYFTPEPLGDQGKVAFVYPGAFNSYPGMGRELFILFPHLFQSMGKVTTDIGDKLREKLVYPRSLTALDDEAIKRYEALLQGDAIAMLISGTSLAFLYTSVLRDAFGLHPAAAFGYSLGEFSMGFATGVWTSGDGASSRLQTSPVFVDRLAGPQNAIRQAWGMPTMPVEYRSNLWANYVLMAAPEAVTEAVKLENRVYLTHINTPRQVVIGGDPAACQRVIARLHCNALQAPFNYALHCDPIRMEYDGLAHLHTWPVQSIPDVTLFTAATYEPAVIEENALGKGIAHALVNPLDFPRLINRVYATGARIFIEVGAGSNCSRWIDETLKESSHSTFSINRRGTDDSVSIIRLLARLVSHRVPVNLDPLAAHPLTTSTPEIQEDQDWQSWL